MARKKILFTCAVETDLKIVADFLNATFAEPKVQEAMKSVGTKVSKLKKLEEANELYHELLRKAWKIDPSTEKTKVPKKVDPSSKIDKPKKKLTKGTRKNKIATMSLYEKRRAEEKYMEQQEEKEREKQAVDGIIVKGNVISINDHDVATREKLIDASNSPVSDSDANTSDVSAGKTIPVAAQVNSMLEPHEEFLSRMMASEHCGDTPNEQKTAAFENSDDINEQAFLQNIRNTIIFFLCGPHGTDERGELPRFPKEDFESVEAETAAIFEDPKASAAEVRTRELMSGQPVEEAQIVPPQQLFEHDISEVVEEDAVIALDAEQKTRGSRIHFEKSVKLDVRISVKKIRVRKQIGVDEEGVRNAPPVESNLGPRGAGYTWATLITLATLIVKFVFPLSRVTKLLSSVSKQFSRSTIWYMLTYVGETLLPAYIGLIQESAFHGVQFHADDTDAVTRTTVREVQAGGRVTDVDESKSKAEKPKTIRNLPNASIERIRKLLPYRSKKADGKKDKEKLHLSVVIGRTDLKCPHAWFFVYYTHIGSVGNILTQYLNLRKERLDKFEKILKEKKEEEKNLQPIRIKEIEDLLRKIPRTIAVIRDQSSQNTAKIPESFGFTIKTYGCLMHARRKFRHPAGHDEIVSTTALWCELMISYVFRVESWCKLAGRTVDRVRRLRERYTRSLLYAVETFCLGMRDSEPVQRYRDAAEYFLNNKDDFFAHIDDPYVAVDSGLPERAIRTKKLFARSSFGHETKRGTVCYDVIRSVMATCTACGISFSAYFRWIAMQREQFGDEEFRAMDPMSLTPQAYMKTLSDNLSQ